MLTALLLSAAFADCLPVYESRVPRLMAGGVVSTGAGLSSTALATPTIVFGILAGAIAKSDAVVASTFLLTGTELAAGVGLSVGGGVMLARRSSYRRVLELIDESQLGSGPALSAYLADLNAETGGGWNLSNVAAAVWDLNDRDAFCGPDGLIGFREADLLIRQRLDAGPAEAPFEVLPAGEKPEMP